MIIDILENIKKSILLAWWKIAHKYFIFSCMIFAPFQNSTEQMIIPKRIFFKIPVGDKFKSLIPADSHIFVHI